MPSRPSRKFYTIWISGGSGHHIGLWGHSRQRRNGSEELDSQQLVLSLVISQLLGAIGCVYMIIVSIVSFSQPNVVNVCQVHELCVSHSSLLFDSCHLSLPSPFPPRVLIPLKTPPAPTCDRLPNSLLASLLPLTKYLKLRFDYSKKENLRKRNLQIKTMDDRWVKPNWLNHSY